MKRYLITLAAFLAIVSPLSAQMVTNNKVLAWSTSAGQNGTMKIVAVNGQYFEAQQTNEKNKAAGVVKLYGATLDGGKKIVLINIGQWKETWEGTVSGSEINGNLVAGSAKYTFKITEPVVAVAAVAGVNPFVNGSTLTWNTSAGQNGTIKVTAVNGAKFNLDQINFNNRGAGTTKLDGEVKDGKVFIYNRQWNETWVGTLSGDKIAGKINNVYDFTINMTAQTAVSTVASTAPFINGKTLKWNTSAGQTGTITVTSVSGTKFNLDQVNFNNRAAGTTKLDGEVKDGKVYIYNRQWNETWVGTNNNGKVTGKINNRYDFTVTE